MFKTHVLLAIIVLGGVASQTRGQFPATISPPAALNTDATSDMLEDYSAQVASDGKGNWVAVWTTDEDPGCPLLGDILVARSTDNGVTWTAPEFLNSNPGGAGSPDDQLPQIATDGDGNWVTIWTSRGFSGADRDILVARSTDNGATWTPVAALNTNAGSDTGDDDDPNIATDGAGHWVAVWESQENLGGSIGTDRDIFVARSEDNGATWTPPAALNTNAAADTTATDEVPHVATDGQGNWVAVWDAEKFQGNDSDILMARSTDNGETWTAPAALNSDAGTDTRADGRARTATDGQGHWVAVWESSNPLGGMGTDLDILVALSTDNGTTWTAAAPLNNNAASDAGFDDDPYLTTDGQGNWVTLWQTREDPGAPTGADRDILVAHSSDNGATWTDPVPLNTNAATDSGLDFDSGPIATDGRGNWVGAWDSIENIGGTLGGEGDILTARFALPDCNGNGVGDGQDIADGVSGDCDANGIPDDCESDTDADGVIDACDECPDDPDKTAPGDCGCGVADEDANGNGMSDCLDANECCGGGLPALMPLMVFGWGAWRRRRRIRARFTAQVGDLR